MNFNLIVPVILSRALFVAADLQIADHLAKNACTTTELATITNTKPDALHRLLYFLSLHDVFKQDNQLWKNTSASECMRIDHECSVRPFLLHDDPTRWNAYGHLGEVIASGREVFSDLYGSDYFTYIHQDEKLGKQFDDAMRVISDKEENIIAQRMPFAGVVADIGGGKGGLAQHILATSPDVTRVMLFDLPAVIANNRIQEHPIVGVPGDFFSPITLTADIFVLKRILHDWDDAHAARILMNVAQSMRTGDKLYIVDGLLDRARDKKLLAAIDLAMLTLFGGKERSFDEFNTLIEGVGLRVVEVCEMTETLFVLVCMKETGQ